MRLGHGDSAAHRAQHHCARLVLGEAHLDRRCDIGARDLEDIAGARTRDRSHPVELVLAIDRHGGARAAHHRFGMGQRRSLGAICGVEPAHPAPDRGGQVGHDPHHRRAAHRPRDPGGGGACRDREDIAARREVIAVGGHQIVDHLRLDRDHDDIEALALQRVAIGKQPRAIGCLFEAGVDDGEVLVARHPVVEQGTAHLTTTDHEYS